MRVLVVDDHEVVRRGISAILSNEPSFTICGEAADGQDAVEKAQQLQPDVVVMDVSMPRMNGLEATREIKRLCPRIEIVIVSQHDVPEMVRQAFNAGAGAYVVKSAVARDLLAAIAKVYQRDTAPKVVQLSDTDSILDAQEILQRSAAFESALRESEERFRSAMNNMAEGLYTIDTQGLVTYINPSAEAMFGWTSDELIGKKIHDVTHFKHPDGTPFPASECSGLQVLQKGVELREHEDTFIRKDGSFFPVVFSASPMKIRGETIGMVVSFRDDTKRREAAAVLRREVVAMNILQEVSTRFGSHVDLRELGEMSLDAAIALTGAQKGNIQLLDAATGALRIFAQRGFEQDFIDFFDKVRDVHIAGCGAALRSKERVVVEDVLTDPIFAGTPEQQVVLNARVRAVQSTPLLTCSGRIVGVLSTHFDAPHQISPKEMQLLDVLARQTADFIERFENQDTMRLRSAIVNSSDDAIVSKNLNGIITSWNPGAERIFGYRPDEAIGRSITLIIPPELQTEEAMILERIKMGEQVEHFETVRVRKDGTLLDISLTVSPVKDGTGRVIGASKVARNITEQKQIERALHESEDRFRTIVETTPECVKLVSYEGTLLHMNSAGLKLVGAECAEMVVGKNVYDIIAPHDRERYRAFNEKVCSGEKGSLEFDIVGLNGVGRHMQTHATPLVMPDGKNVQLAVTRDISERTQVEKELRDSQARLRRLADGLETEVHGRTQELEQRNTEIIQQSEQLRELSNRLLKTQDEERRRIARELHDGVGQLLAAMQMNLATVRVEKAHLSSRACKALDENAALIEQTSQEIRTMSHLLHPPLLDEMGLESALCWYVEGFAERSKIDVRLELIPGFSAGLPRDLALALFRIVQECLTNVHRHSESPTALVKITRSSDEITLEIKDEGNGIPAEIESKISSGKSSGVGLRGMRERIRQFNGRLEIHSDQPGTRIISVLPVSPIVDTGVEVVDEYRDANRLLAPTVDHETGHGATAILCIDDETSGLYPRRLLLESAGHRVIEARSGEEGIRLFRSEKIDAVILDYWMAGMKGTTVAFEMKRINPAIPIIVLSGVSDLPGEAAGLVDQWLVKGSHPPEQLLNSISALLARRPV